MTNREGRIFTLVLNGILVGMSTIGIFGAYSHKDYSSSFCWGIMTVIFIGNLLAWDHLYKDNLSNTDL